MPRWLSVLGLLAVGVLVAGAATFTSPNPYSAVAAFTAGNEGQTGPTDPAAGLDLAEVKGFMVTLEAPIAVDAGAQNVVPAGVYLRAWVFNPHAKAPDGGTGGWWSRAPDLDLGPTSGGKLSESWHGFSVKAGAGRLAYLPDNYANAGRVIISGVRGQ